MVKVHTPVPGVNKVIAGIPFTNGVGEVASDNSLVLRYFQRHGYKIDSGSAKQEGTSGEKTGEVGLNEMSVPELRAFAKAHEIDIKGLQSKADIRAAIVDAKSAEMSAETDRANAEKAQGEHDGEHDGQPDGEPDPA